MTIPTIDSVTAAEALAAANANSTVAATSVSSTAPDISASIVDFSPLAQLLATTVLFQTQQAAQAAQAPQVPASTGTDTDFQQTAATTAQFVNAFNNFQISSADSLSTPFDATFENALLQELHAQNTLPGSTNSQSLIDSLAAVGINFQEATNPTNPNQFQINSTALEAAFSANPTQTSTLLSNALQGLSAIEEKLILGQSATGSDLFTTQLNTVNSTDAAATAAVQPMLAEEALIVSVDTNLTPTQTATTVAQATTPVTAAENTPVTAPGAATAATVAATAANAAANNATATPVPVTTAPAATVVDPVIANTTAANAATNANVVQAAMTPNPIDPLIAVAVAAYRAGEAIANIPTNHVLINPAVVDTVPDIDPVDRVNPIGPNSKGRNGER